MTNPNENNQTPDLSPLAQDLIQTEAPDNALEALLAELEETADEVRTELEARRRNAQRLISDDAATRAESEAGAETGTQEPVTERTETVVTPEPAQKPAYAKKLNPNVTPEQAEELENFPDYFGTPKGTWANLFKMLREFRAEMQEGKKNA